MKYSLKALFTQEYRPYWYSLGAHLALILLIIILSHSNIKIFTTGTAVQSQQQVQIVNATLVLPPSPSKVITDNPPAPAPPSPPVTTPSQEVNPKPEPTPAPVPQKPVPQKTVPDKTAPIVQKQQPQPQKKASSTVKNQQALQNLKALGLSSIKQAIDTNQQEAASAAQAAEDLSLKEKYMGLIQQTIRANWINQFDPNANLTVTLQITLDKAGNVLSVTVNQTSGNPNFDRQAVLAVKKSSPLPLPPDPNMAKDFLNLTLPFSNQT